MVRGISLLSGHSPRFNGHIPGRRGVFIALPNSSIPVSAVAAFFASLLYGLVTYRTSGVTGLLQTSFLLKIPFFFLLAAFGTLISRQARELRRQKDENKRLSAELRHRLEKAAKSKKKLHDDLLMLYNYNENILNSIDTGVIVMDLSGTITAFNRAAERITGLKSDDVLFRKADEYRTLEGLGNMMQAGIDTLFRRKETEIETASGEKRTIGMSIYLLRQRKDRVIGIIGVFADLTEIKALREKVKRSEHLAMLGQMAASVAHEVRNPLSSIQGLSDLMASQTDKGDERKKYAAIISKEASRINRTIQEILTFSRTRKPELSPLDANDLLNEIVDSMKVKAEEANVDIDWQPGDDLPEISGDRHQLSKVFSNLILNAIQALEEGGNVELLTRKNKEGVVIEIRDDGAGIPMEIQQKIFNPFFTTKDKGTGLGLAIARKIVEEHGGTIEVHSDGEKGTNFTVKFPVEADNSEQTGNGAPDSLKTGKTILVADDDPTVRNFCKEVLESAGHSVVLAEDGQQAIRKTLSGNVDLLVLDIKMPLFDGILVMEHLSKTNPELPIIVSSGYADMKDDYTIRNSNVIAYLSKPVQIFEFQAKVEQALTATSRDEKAVTRS
ncbi:MAG: ATP-binding protein [bacterium]